MTDLFEIASIEGFLVVVDGMPDLMTLLSPSGRHVAGLVPDKEDRHSIYLAARVSDETWKDYLSGAVDLRSLFTKCETGNLHRFDLDAADYDGVRLHRLATPPDESELPLPGFLSENHTEDYNPRQNHVELLCHLHFNEPVISAGRLARLVGYGETPDGPAFILRAVDGIFWTGAETAPVFLRCVSDHASSDIRTCDARSDLGRIDEMLFEAGVWFADEFITDIRQAEAAGHAGRTPGPGDHIMVRDRRDGAIAVESDYILRIDDSDGTKVAVLRDAGFAVPLSCCEPFNEENLMRRRP